MEQVWVFLERNGTNLIYLPVAEEEPLEAAREFMRSNELPLLGEPFSKGNVIFAPVDASDPSLSLFYSSAETPPGTTPVRDVWRNFLWMPESDVLGINALLKEIQLSDVGDTVYSVLADYRQVA